MGYVNPWVQLNISRIEDLSDAVLGAGLEVMQMGLGRISGSLAYATYENVIYSSGLIQGQVALSGPLSKKLVTFCIGLCIGKGSKYWLNEFTTGDICVLHAGDNCDALYTPGSLYVALSMSAEHIEIAAAKNGLVLNVNSLGGTGFHPRKLSPKIIEALRIRVEHIHAGQSHSNSNVLALNESLLDNVIAHYARQPYFTPGRTKPVGLAAIVAKAREYIEDNLQNDISIEAATHICGTSRRTLFRAFNAVLGESPHAYIKRLRLHRIRKDLIFNSCSVSYASHQWGISECGRMSGEYREIFSELPSETLSHKLKYECEI